MKKLTAIALLSILIISSCIKDKGLPNDNGNGGDSGIGDGDGGGDGGGGGGNGGPVYVTPKITMEAVETPSSVAVGKNQIVHYVTSVHNYDSNHKEVPMVVLEISVSKQTLLPIGEIHVPNLKNECSPITTYRSFKESKVADKDKSHIYITRNTLEDSKIEKCKLMHLNDSIVSGKKYKLETSFNLDDSHKGAELKIKMYSVVIDDKETEITTSAEHIYTYKVQ